MAEDEKISALAAKTTVHDNDLFALVDTEADPDETKKITGANMKTQMTSAHAALTDIHSISRTATYVVAANDAPALVKAQADYVCNGTDDHVEIQAAITAIGATGGRVVLIGGTFVCNAQISLDGKNNLELVGVGFPTLNFNGCAAETHSLWYQSSGLTNSVIRGLRVINSKYTAIIGKGTGVTIENNIVEDAYLQGINVAGTNFLVQHNVVDGVTTEFGIVLGGLCNGIIISNNIVRDTGADGIQWGYSGENVQISDNIIVDAGDHGIEIRGIESAPTYYTRRFNIINNLIINPTANGIYVGVKSTASISPVHLVSDGLIMGNHIIDCVYGVQVLGQSDGRIVARIHIKANVVETASSRGVDLERSEDYRIEGNTFRNIGSQGISVGSDDGYITSNLIDTVTYDGVAMSLNNEFTNVVVAFNIFRNIDRDDVRNNNATTNAGNVDYNFAS